MLKLVLASQSPRRREILANAGLVFDVRVAGVPEEHQRGESAEDYVKRLSRAKAEAVGKGDDEVVLGADTVVVLDEHIMEKPRDAEEAVWMLRILSGREHVVLTGISILYRDIIVTDVAETRVTFTEISDAEIEQYVDSGEPLDKAGAYAIQGLASKFVSRIEGCYFNVVGLPISLVYQYLRVI